MIRIISVSPLLSGLGLLQLTLQSVPLVQRKSIALENSEPVTSTTIQTQEDTQVRYKTLSYTWGPETPSHVILVNGCEFTVRENLYGFLDCCRRRAWSYPLWVDQICINQNDVKERNSQVSMMEDIYTNANETFVWLGYADEQSDRVMQWLISYDDKHDFSISDLESLWSRSYWSRLWIFQELWLSRKISVICGENVAPFWKIYDLWSELVQSDNPRLHPNKFVWGLYVALIPSHWGAETGDFGKLDLLDSPVRMRTLLGLRPHQCSNPLDKVYGVQSVFPATYRVHVDYNRSVDELFWIYIVRNAPFTALEQLPWDPEEYNDFEDFVSIMKDIFRSVNPLFSQFESLLWSEIGRRSLKVNTRRVNKLLHLMHKNWEATDGRSLTTNRHRRWKRGRPGRLVRTSGQAEATVERNGQVLSIL